MSAVRGTSVAKISSSPAIYEDVGFEESLANESAIEISPPDLASNSHYPFTAPNYDSEKSEILVDLDIEIGLKVKEAKNEHHYRTLLNHRYHSSRKSRINRSLSWTETRGRIMLVSLALWEPVEVEIGAVGYLSKPSGSFVTLFNAINPSKSSDSRINVMPSITGYGTISIRTHRHSTRNAALRGLDAVVGFLSSGKRDEFPVK